MNVHLIWKITGIAVIAACLIDIYIRHFYGLKKEKTELQLRRARYISAMAWFVSAFSLLIIGLFAIAEHIRRLFL